MNYKEFKETSEWNYQTLKGIFKFILWATYDVKSFGVEKLNEISSDTGFLLTANHGSIVDAFVMGLKVDTHRVRFVGRRRTLWSNPIFAKINNIVGTVPVPESKTNDKSIVINVSVDALQKGACIGIFPEGAILRRQKKFNGKTGTARMALKAGVPLVPVGLLGTDGLWPYGAKMPRLGRPVEMNVGKPLYFDEFHGQEDRFEVVRYVTDVLMKEIRVQSGWWGVPREKIIELHKYYKSIKPPEA